MNCKKTAIVTTLAIMLAFSVSAQQTSIVNNLKKEFVPAVTGTAAKTTTRNGLVSEYTSDPSATVSVGVQPYDNDLIIVYLYIRNSSNDTLSIDPSQIHCDATVVSGDRTALVVVDPEKLFRDRISSVSGAAFVSPNYANSSVLKPVPAWYEAVSQHDQAISLGDILPGEQVSGIVLLQQPYGPAVTAKRGGFTRSTQTEILFKDVTVTVPVGGKPYAFQFTVNNDKK